MTDMALLGALVATNNLTPADAFAIAEFSEHVDVQYKESPATLEAAIDMALGFFNEAPDVEAEKVADNIRSIHSARSHDEDVCPDCGGEMMDEADMEQAIDLWVAVRMVCDKYAFDQAYDGIDRDDC